MNRLIVLTVFFLVPASATSQPCDSLNALEWILGDWTARGAKNITIESWSRVSPETFEGRGVVTSKDTGEVRSTESMRLVTMSGEVFMIPKAAHNEMPTPFKGTACSEGLAVFINKEHDFPKELKYEQTDPDSLYVYVSDGEANGFVLRFGRQPE